MPIEPADDGGEGGEERGEEHGEEGGERLPDKLRAPLDGEEMGVELWETPSMSVKHETQTGCVRSGAGIVGSRSAGQMARPPLVSLTAGVCSFRLGGFPSVGIDKATSWMGSNVLGVWVSALLALSTCVKSAQAVVAH
jgi:hypothetical protein